MKQSIAILSAIIGVASAAAAETLWVYGASEQGGWYDADKTGTNDTQLCWAAVSSNLINWWQSQYEVPSYRYIPTQQDEVWSKYKNNVVGDVVADARIGLEWWLSGYGFGYFNESSYNLSLAGYYDAYVKYDEIYWGNKYVRHVDGTGAQLTLYLWETLSAPDVRQGIGLNIAGHGITLWGAEFANPQTITAFYVTDSDDAISTKTGDLDLFKVAVKYTENGSMYLAGPEEENGYWSGAKSVNSLTIIDANETDAWNLPRIYLSAPIPEPSTATLSLLALGCLAVRRRRK